MGLASFDLEDPTQGANKFLAHPMLVMECQYSCVGTSKAESYLREPTPLGISPWLKTYSENTYLVSLDIPPQFTMLASVLTQPGREGRKLVPFIELRIRGESLSAGQDRGEDWLRMWLRRVIALDPGNRIKCRGALPTFSPPPPYSDHHHFRNNQILCATELDFGNP